MFSWMWDLLQHFSNTLCSPNFSSAQFEKKHVSLKRQLSRTETFKEQDFRSLLPRCQAISLPVASLYQRLCMKMRQAAISFLKEIPWHKSGYCKLYSKERSGSHMWPHLEGHMWIYNFANRKISWSFIRIMNRCSRRRKYSKLMFIKVQYPEIVGTSCNTCHLQDRQLSPALRYHYDLLSTAPELQLSHHSCSLLKLLSVTQ